MAGKYQGSIQAKEDFDDVTAANNFRKAWTGCCVDAYSIIGLLVSHNNQQRQEIRDMYEAIIGRELIEDLKGQLGGHFEDAVVALLTETYVYLTDILHDGLKSGNGNEKALVDSLCGRSAKDIDKLKSTYEEKYGHSLDSDISKELSGNFKRIMKGLVSSGREEESEMNEERAKKDAKELYDVGIRLSNDSNSKKFFKNMNTRSYCHLAVVFKEYEKLAQDTLENAISKEFSGDMKAGLLAIIQCVKDPPEFYATRLNKAMAGAGTDNKSLIRIIVSRSEIDLADIRSKYKELYGKELVDDIKRDTSGDYSKLLVAIVNGCS